MTLPAFQAVGTGHESSVAWPTHAAGHFAMCFVEHSEGTVATPSGWTVIPGLPLSVASTTLSGFYRFATSGAESNFAISGPTNHAWGVIITYTGVNTLNPFHLFAGNTQVSTASKYWPGLQTFLNDCMIVNVATWQIDNAGPLSSLEANASLGSLTERYDAGTITGDGGGIVIIDGTLATKGAFTYTESTLSSAAISILATLALQAADQTFGQKTRIVNLGKQRMAIPVKQSVAHDFDVFMADSADGKTGKTGLTLAVTLKKSGGTSFSSVSPTVTELGSGNYKIAFTGANNDTVGTSSGRATATGADPADFPNFFDVVAWDKTDGAGLGLSRIDAAITTRLAPTTAGRTLDVTATGEAGIDWANIGSPTTTQNLSGTLIKDATDVETKLGTPAGASVSADIAAVKTDTAAVKTKTDQLTFTVANQVDANALTGGGGASAADVADAVWDEVRSGHTTAGSYGATSEWAGQVDTGAIADAVWDEARSGHTTAGTFGQGAASVQGNVTGSVASVTGAVGSVTGAVGSIATGGITAASIATGAITAAKFAADAITSTVLATSAAQKIRDSILDYAYRSGRSVRGLFRRLSASLEVASGLIGTTATFKQPDGTTTEFSVTQDPSNGSRSAVDVTNSETP